MKANCKLHDAAAFLLRNTRSIKECNLRKFLLDAHEVLVWLRDKSAESFSFFFFLVCRKEAAI